MKRKALFIGVNDYRDPAIRNLSCSVRDAISMHDIFEELGYQTNLLENPGKGDVFHAIRKITSDMALRMAMIWRYMGLCKKSERSLVLYRRVRKEFS